VWLKLLLLEIRYFVWKKLLLFEIRYLVWMERLLLEILYFVWLKLLLREIRYFVWGELLLLEIRYLVWEKRLLLIAVAYWSTMVVSAANAADRNPFVSVRYRLTYTRRIRGQQYRWRLNGNKR